MTSPPEEDTSKGRVGVAEAEGDMAAPTLPELSLESEGEEDAMARYVFSIPAEEYWPSTSAYVRVKVFKKTILAKMLIDSGNLVSDLISREFANLAGLQYEPERKKVGTAAKGGSVSIVGRLIQLLQLHIEKISTPVFLRPYVVDELLHPINVGRDVLGRYKGQREGNAGFLEVGGQKVKLIAKREELCHAGVTDCKLRRVMDLPGGSDCASKQMVWRGKLNHVGDATAGSEPIFLCQKTVIPAESGVFVPFQTNPEVAAD